MVVPKVGQDPVCYNEVVAVQRASEEKPQADGTTLAKTSRSPRKKAVDATLNGASGTKQTAVTTRKTTARATTARKKTTTRASTAQKAMKRTPTSRTKTAKSK